MIKEMKIYYQHRNGIRGDLPTVPKLVIANHILEKICGFSIGDKVTIEYVKGSIIITKLNSNL
jgi:hypothetical protein